VDDIFEFVEPVAVASPCINVCRLDPATRWCLGCARTGAEIARWTAIDDAARQAILDVLPERLRALPAAKAR